MLSWGRQRKGGFGGQPPEQRNASGTNPIGHSTKRRWPKKQKGGGLGGEKGWRQKWRVKGVTHQVKKEREERLMGGKNWSDCGTVVAGRRENSTTQELEKDHFVGGGRSLWGANRRISPGRRKFNYRQGLRENELFWWPGQKVPHLMKIGRPSTHEGLV